MISAIWPEVRFLTCIVITQSAWQSKSQAAQRVEAFSLGSTRSTINGDRLSINGDRSTINGDRLTSKRDGSLVLLLESLMKGRAISCGWGC